MNLKKFEINITFRCNLKCPYCSMKERINQKKSLNENKDVLNLINSIPKNSTLILSGGEPGLCRKEFLLKIIKIAKNKNLDLELNTNGLFIKRYSDLLIFFSRINLHIVPNSDIELEKLKKYNVNFVYILCKDEDVSAIYFKYGRLDIIPSTHYDLIENEYTYKGKLNSYFKYMTPESIVKYLTRSRYNICYLN